MKKIVLNNTRIFVIAIVISFLSSILFMGELYAGKFLISSVENNQILGGNAILSVLAIYGMSYLVFFIKLRVENKLLAKVKMQLNYLYVKKSIGAANPFSKQTLGVAMSQKIPYLIENFFFEILDILYDFAFLLLGSIYIAKYSIAIAVSSFACYILAFLITNFFSTYRSNLFDIKAKACQRICERSEEIEHEKSQYLLLRDSPMFQNEYEEMISEYTRADQKFNICKGVFDTFMAFFTAGREIIVLLLLFFLKGKIDLGTVFLILYLSNTLSAPLQSIVAHIGNIKATKGMRAEINGIISPGKMQKESDEPKVASGITGISLENITLQKKDRILVSDFSKTFTSPKKYLVKGKSGIGKTTFLKIIAGREKASAGKVIFNDGTEAALERLYGVGAFLSQDSSLFETHLLDNITLFQEQPNLKKVSELKDKLQIKQENDYLIKDGSENISGGERNKILLARALYRGVDLLLIDEIFSSIDQESIGELLNNLITENLLMICVNHNLEQYEGLFDEVVCLLD